MFVSLVTICLFIGFILILLYDQYNREARLIRQIPGPKRWPIVGNTINFLLPLDKLFLYLRKMPREFGDIVQIHAIHERTIGFLDPDNIETILSSLRFSDKNIPYNFMRPWLGEGLLTSQGQKWHQRRKLLTQAFHFNILKKYSITFAEQTEKLLYDVQERVNEKKLDIVPLITSTTLRIMCATAMGTSMHESIESVASKYSRAIEEVGKAIVERMCRIWLHVDYFYKWSNIFKTQESALKDLHTFTTSIINERRTYLQENGIETFEDEESNGKKGRLAMLDLLLEKEKVGDIDVDGIREEVDTFMFEGHDTTAQALTFLIMTIANEPRVQEKIYEELQNIFKGNQNTPTTDELNEMKYLECCIKESLRLYPSVPIILRYLTEEITVGGYTIPRNSHIHISIYDLHRRADLYPEPERFIPERFLPEACAKRHPYAYIPFSAGPRNCIGQKFAMLEMKTLVSSLLRKYRLEAVTKPSDLKFRTDILLRTNNESIYVNFFNRC
ncbi:cytochrome P450 4C1-like isoform X1 [Vanessa atalanta]|uniref:cytochrome P450 4C1-like isoform X1 n=1 Tax=Vanessa atalanta TaxID=42275 RepID=UPI001FCD3F2C|nr:cytochrome P450 4C1-like isoform X1 [Vanessa atalanta]